MPLLCHNLFSHRIDGLVVKASASGAEDSEVDSRLRRVDFAELGHTSDLNIGYQALVGQCWDWLARCQYTVIG